MVTFGVNLIYKKTVGSSQSVGYGSGFKSNGGSFSISSLPSGNYRFYYASKGSNEAEWQPVRSNEGVCNSYTATVSGGSVTSLSKEMSNWTATAIGSIAAPAHGNASNGIFSIGGRSLGTLNT